MVGAGEPIILTPDALDAITAGSAGADVTAISAAIGESGTLTATSATTSAISGQVSRASGDGGALAVAPGDGLAGTSITNTAGTDNGSSGAWVSTQTSSAAAGDATATSGSQTRATATPGANIAVGTGYASATGDTTSVDASTSLYGYGDIVIGRNNPNWSHYYTTWLYCANHRICCRSQPAGTSSLSNTGAWRAIGGRLSQHNAFLDYAC